MTVEFSDLQFRQATASERKLIASLQQSKYRRREGLFVIEGTRGVCDTLRLFDIVLLAATPSWLQLYGNRLASVAGKFDIVTIAEADMTRISAMKTPQGVLAVCRIPESQSIITPHPDELILALDCIQDPGNLGTIIRLADWFGIRTILASTDTVDVYNPKVVQATMGALARVSVHYCDLADALAHYSRNSEIRIFGTFLDGENIYGTTLSGGGILVMGNEGNGISQAVARHIGSRLLIPSFPPGQEKVESLNVATATAIALGEFRRQAQLKP